MYNALRFQLNRGGSAMLRIVIHLLLLLTLIMGQNAVLANNLQPKQIDSIIVVADSTSDFTTHPPAGITRKTSTKTILASGNNADWESIGYKRQLLPKKGHLVFSQIKPKSFTSSSDPKDNVIYTGYISGHGHPDNILQNHSAEIRWRQNEHGFGPPKIIQYHEHETAASSHVHELREQNKQAGYASFTRVDSYSQRAHEANSEISSFEKRFGKGSVNEP